MQTLPSRTKTLNLLVTCRRVLRGFHFRLYKAYSGSGTSPSLIPLYSFHLGLNLAVLVPLLLAPSLLFLAVLQKGITGSRVTATCFQGGLCQSRLTAHQHWPINHWSPRRGRFLGGLVVNNQHQRRRSALRPRHQGCRDLLRKSIA